jgi:hypothetical protein
MGLSAFLGVLGYFKFRQDFKAGETKANLEHSQEDLKNAVDENKALSNRPRTSDDRADRLRKWIDKLPNK